MAAPRGGPRTQIESISAAPEQFDPRRVNPIATLAFGKGIYSASGGTEPASGAGRTTGIDSEVPPLKADGGRKISCPTGLSFRGPRRRECFANSKSPRDSQS